MKLGNVFAGSIKPLLLSGLITAAFLPEGVQAQPTVSSAQVDLYHSAVVTGGSLNVSNPPPTSTSGNQNWNGSASSTGTGSISSNGAYATQVSSTYFALSGTAWVSSNNTTLSRSGVAANSLTINFTVPVLSEAVLLSAATISSLNPGNYTVAGLQFFANDEQIVFSQLFTTGSFSQTVSLAPGTNYRFIASLEAGLTDTTPTTQTTSVLSNGISMQVNAVPEPTTWALLGLGGMALGLAARRRGRA